MPFDFEKLAGTKMEPRREVHPVPDLAAFFPEGEKPEWVLRGLTGAEWAKALEAEQKQLSMSGIADMLNQASGVDVGDLKRALGIAKGTPAELAKRLEMFVMGSVSPKVTLENAVMLAERYALDFWVMTRIIVNLTGKGFDVVKPDAASQPTQD